MWTDEWTAWITFAGAAGRALGWGERPFPERRETIAGPSVVSRAAARHRALAAPREATSRDDRSGWVL